MACSHYIYKYQILDMAKKHVLLGLHIMSCSLRATSTHHTSKTSEEELRDCKENREHRHEGGKVQHHHRQFGSCDASLCGKTSYNPEF